LSEGKRRLPPGMTRKRRRLFGGWWWGGGCVGEIFAVKDDAGFGLEAFVVFVLYDVTDVDVVGEAALFCGEVEHAVCFGVDGEPVAAVNLCVVGGEGWGEVFMAVAEVVWDVLAFDEDDLELFLVYPDAALKVTLVFDEFAGFGVEDEGVKVVDVLLAEVGDGVLGELGCGEDEGEAVGDVVKVSLRHHEAGEGVLRGKDDALCGDTLCVEDDVCDLLVLAVDFFCVVEDGLYFDGLTEDELLTGFGEGGLSLAELLDDLVRSHAGGCGGVEGTKAGGLGVGRSGGVLISDSGMRGLGVGRYVR